MSLPAKIQYEQELISLKNLKTIITLALVVCIGIFIGFADIIREPSAMGIPSKSSLQDKIAYYATIQDWDAYDEAVRQLREYYPEDADHENETATQLQEPSTKPQTPAFQHYADVPNDAWYAEAVNAMTQGDLLNGYSDGLFHPNDYVTQGQFAKILTDIYNIHPYTDESSMPAGCEKCGYNMATHTTYATEHWALKYAWDACSTGEYCPDWCGCTLDYPVWRGDAISVANTIAKHMSKYYDYENSQWKYKTEKIWTESDIPDWDTVPNKSIYDSWVAYFDRDGHRFNANKILTAYNLGITQGIDDNGTCGFFNPMTRAELCQMLYNMGITRKGEVRN